MQDIQIIDHAGQAPAVAKERERQSLITEFEKVGIDERFIAQQLRHVIDNAECSTPKGEIIEDYATKLSAIKAWHKMRSATPDVQVNIANVFPGNSGL